MRRALLLAMLILPAACSLFPPNGQRFVVFFPDAGFALDSAATQVIAAAADYAVAHPDRPILVAGFADPTGTPEANATLIRSRTATVNAELASHGIAATRIQTRDIGQVEFALSSQESRRVTVTVGTP